MSSIFEDKITKEIRLSAYRIYQDAKKDGVELTVEDIYERMNKKPFGRSGMTMKELCERGGISEKDIRKAILECIKTASIDSLS